MRLVEVTEDSRIVLSNVSRNFCELLGLDPDMIESRYQWCLPQYMRELWEKHKDDKNE
jgi:hypothetical protein